MEDDEDTYRGSVARGEHDLMLGHVEEGRLVGEQGDALLAADDKVVVELEQAHDELVLNDRHLVQARGGLERLLNRR